MVRQPRGFKTDDTLPVLTHDPELFFRFQLDLVVEVAGHQPVYEHGERVLSKGADLMLTSVGALADERLLERLLAAARTGGGRIRLPSAGGGALDVLAAAAIGGLDRVVITVRQAPAAWQGTAAERALDLDSVVEPVTVYDGPVRAGAATYSNVNVSAAVALAGLGLDATRLRLIVDPGITAHVMEVEAEGRFGQFSYRQDVAVTDDPKAARLVSMAVVKTLRQMTAPLTIGG